MNAQWNFAGPLHEQVHDWLRHRIIAGEWRSGTVIPGEAELSRDLGVSIGTVRKALEKLANDRLVIRERGRGTFVADDSVWRAHQGFRLCDQNGDPISPTISLVDSASDWASSTEATTLKLRRRTSAAGMRVLRVRREWYHHDKLVCRESIIVEESRFPDLGHLMVPDAPTFFDIYASAYRMSVARTIWSLKPAVEENSPSSRPSTAIRCIRIAYAAKAVAIELCEQMLLCDSELIQISL